MLDPFFLLGWGVCMVAVLGWIRNGGPPGRSARRPSTPTTTRRRSGGARRRTSKRTVANESTPETVTRATRVLNKEERGEAARAMRKALRPSISVRSHRGKKS